MLKTEKYVSLSKCIFCIVGYNSLKQGVEPGLNLNLQFQTSKVCGLSFGSKMIWYVENWKQLS